MLAVKVYPLPMKCPGKVAFWATSSEGFGSFQEKISLFGLNEIEAYQRGESVGCASVPEGVSEGGRLPDGAEEPGQVRGGGSQQRGRVMAMEMQKEPGLVHTAL